MPEQHEDKGQKLIQEIVGLGEMLQIMEADTAKCRGALEQNRTEQFWRRVSLRDFGANVEAVLHILRRSTLVFADVFGLSLSIGEYVVLNEESYSVDQSGAVQTMPKYLRFKSSLLFSFGITARVAKSAFQLNRSHHGFKALIDSMEVRDRLMHPKQPEGLIVSDAELQNLFVAEEWFQAEVDRLFADIQPSKLQARFEGTRFL